MTSTPQYRRNPAPRHNPNAILRAAGRGRKLARMAGKRVWEHVRGNAIAYLALFVALGGTGAWAAGKVGSGDIAPNAVRSKHIRDGQVKSRDADLVKFRHIEAEELTQGTTRQDAGPAISGQARAGDLLKIHARVDIRRSVGAAGCGVFLGTQGAGAGESGENILTGSSATAQTRYQDLTANGTTEKHAAALRTIPVADAGPYTISLGYYSGNGSTDCHFTDRNLWVEQVR